MDAGHLPRKTMTKVWMRIVPLMALVLVCNYLDRVNLGFAAVTMNDDLGFSKTIFGMGAGFFAIGYALAGIPSTLLLHRLGARRWISITMVAWGLCSAVTALVTSAGQLFTVRFFLGVAEAGFSPGAILYFSYWFPNRYLGRVLGSFFFIHPLSLAFGGAISSVLLQWDGYLGFAGWQWLFIVEALPTLLLAAAVFLFLSDRPGEANWLSASEKQWLAGQLSVHGEQAASGGRGFAWRALAHRRIWLLAAVYLAIGTCGIGGVFFLPLMLQSTGLPVQSIGYVAAIPAVLAAIGVPLWGIWTDRSSRREIVVATACAFIAVGLFGTAVLLPSVWAIAPFSLAMIGFFGCLAAFWTLPPAFLTGVGAATGIACINLVGNLGNFAGPSLLGALYDFSGTYAAGLYSLAAIAALAGFSMVFAARTGVRPQ